MAKESRDRRFINAFMTTWVVHKIDQQPPELLITAYKAALHNFDIAEIERAFGKAITDLRWFPKPAELLAIIKPAPVPAIAVAQKQATYLMNAINGLSLIHI